MTDLTPNDLSHLSDEKFNALCPQGLHAPGPATALSQAAQAVLDAMHRSYDHEPTRRLIAAAVLRAAADQVERKWRNFARKACQEIRAIAAELEHADG